MHPAGSRPRHSTARSFDRRSLTRGDVGALDVANDLLKSVDDLFGGHAVGADFDGVAGHRKAAEGALHIAAVAKSLFGEDFAEVNFFATGLQVLESTAGALFFAGGEENLARGVGEHDCGLVAAL